jgi:hypothetical protein
MNLLQDQQKVDSKPSTSNAEARDVVPPKGNLDVASSLNAPVSNVYYSSFPLAYSASSVPFHLSCFLQWTIRQPILPFRWCQLPTFRFLHLAFPSLVNWTLCEDFLLSSLAKWPSQFVQLSPRFLALRGRCQWLQEPPRVLLPPFLMLCREPVLTWSPWWRTGGLPFFLLLQTIRQELAHFIPFCRMTPNDLPRSRFRTDFFHHR